MTCGLEAVMVAAAVVVAVVAAVAVAADAVADAAVDAAAAVESAAEFGRVVVAAAAVAAVAAVAVVDVAAAAASAACEFVVAVPGADGLVSGGRLVGEPEVCAPVSDVEPAGEAAVAEYALGKNVPQSLAEIAAPVFARAESAANAGAAESVELGKFEVGLGAAVM